MMETFTKTATEIVKQEGMIAVELDKVVLTFSAQQYGSNEQKVFVQFVLDSSGYQNAEVLPITVEVTQEHAVISKLTDWAATIIKDRIATLKRQVQEEKAEAAAAEGTE